MLFLSSCSFTSIPPLDVSSFWPASAFLWICQTPQYLHYFSLSPLSHSIARSLSLFISFFLSLCLSVSKTMCRRATIKLAFSHCIRICMTQTLDKIHIVYKCNISNTQYFWELSFVLCYVCVCVFFLCFRSIIRSFFRSAFSFPFFMMRFIFHLRDSCFILVYIVCVCCLFGF